MEITLRKIRDNHYDDKDYETLMRAYEYAKSAHVNQKRASGEPYFIHPCAVAEILMDLGLDAATVAAAFLHDVIEDTQFTAEDISREFGDEILVDFGCKVNGYCSDITRTCLFGDDGKHEEFKKAYASVLKAHEKAKAEIVAGMTGKEADAVARDYLKACGYGELFTHSLGHGIGLNVHERPSISPKGEAALCDGMVFSDEPGVYKAGEYGIRIEDTVTLINGKIKSFMSKTDKSLVILNRK